jgi:pre-rRNA-processing protein TSR2
MSLPRGTLPPPSPSPSLSALSLPPAADALTLFARGVLSLLDLWPALTIAVAESWGGPDSPAKKTWIASTIIDEFESRAVIVPAQAPLPERYDPKADLPLDQDDVAELLFHMMSDEFDCDIDDGSVDDVARDITRLWKQVTQGRLEMVENLEAKSEDLKKKGFQATRGADPQEADDDDSDETESEDGMAMGMDVDPAPQLVPRQKEEPEVDEDGFTLVKGKGKGRK